ncbi:hypothetical protein RJ639_004580 [Escallonia herrerae]|uniref:Reverse transcriptase RNase H-like domain-containing protein n=1 Tax=Escallonia herrerae TaxID=1293975 RepID=A0AA89B0H7_9ASTE|nr:hypothetical protein RJ639_004580 [Escallonia herrerae]
MKALLEKPNKYIEAEDYLETHRGRHGEEKEEQKKRSWELTPQGGKSTNIPKVTNDVKTRHDDPLVITIKAGNFDVKHVLVDNGSSVEVLFYYAFKKMNISTVRLRKMDTLLYGFYNLPVVVEGIIALPVAIGTPPTQANFMLDFMVVKVPSAYNAILGRPPLNQLQALVLTYHLKMKFLTEHGIGEVKGEQTTAPQCYMTSCRSKNKEALIIEDIREDTKIQRGEPVEDLVRIEVYPRDDQKTVWICLHLKEDIKLELVTEVAVSPVLVREEDGVQKPIYYVSKVLQDVETRYPKIDKIALALIISARRLRPYFQSHTIVILTDQPFRKVLLGLEASVRLVNWSVELGEFDIPYKPRTTIKAQALADIIFECILPEDPPQLPLVAVEQESFSSAPEGFTVEYALRFGFQTLNNEAKYEALLAGIRLAHVLKNTQADTLSRLASAEVTDVRRSVYLEFLKESSISSQTKIGVVDHERCWMDMIIKYLSTGELPCERHEVRNLRVKAAWYALVEGVLYKKSFSLPYLRCLRPSESLYALQEVHEGICGQHLRGRTLAQKILRQGYYWPTM